jgi:Aspartyl protease
MPRLERAIGSDGPIIDVRIWIGPELEQALRARGLQAPRPFSVPGLLDTGAQMSAIQQDLTQAMGLLVHDWVGMRSSVLGEEVRDAPVYLTRMTFGSIEAPDSPKWRIVGAVGVTVVTPGALVLIGQDLLATCRFTYDGRRRRLMVSY